MEIATWMRLASRLIQQVYTNLNKLIDKMFTYPNRPLVQNVPGESKTGDPYKAAELCKKSQEESGILHCKPPPECFIFRQVNGFIERGVYLVFVEWSTHNAVGQ
jgi:hypothetical protein